MNRSALFCLFCVACGANPTNAIPPSPPQPARAQTTAPPSPQLPPPPAEARRATEGMFLGFEGDPQRSSFEVKALAHAPDGSLYFGGGYYGTMTLAGHVLPKRAYETAFLASASPDGAVRWVKTYGTQWHNLIFDLRVLGDGRLLVTGSHGNGFAMDKLALGDIKKAQAFEAVSGFIALLSADGKALFAKNASDFLPVAKNTSVGATALHEADVGYFVELTPENGGTVLAPFDPSNPSMLRGPTLAAPGLATLAIVAGEPLPYEVSHDGSILRLRMDPPKYLPSVEWSRDGTITRSVSLDAFKQAGYRFDPTIAVISDGTGGAFFVTSEAHFQTSPPVPVPAAWPMVARGGIFHLGNGGIDYVPLFDGAVAAASDLPSAKILDVSPTTLRLVLKRAPGFRIGNTLIPKNPGGQPGALVFADFDLASRSITRVWTFDDTKCLRHDDHYFANSVEVGSTLFFSAGRPSREALVARCKDARFADVLAVTLE